MIGRFEIIGLAREIWSDAENLHIFLAIYTEDQCITDDKGCFFTGKKFTCILTGKTFIL